MPVSTAEQRAAAALSLAEAPRAVPGRNAELFPEPRTGSEHSPAARCLQSWKEANKAIQGTNEDKSRHFYLLTNSLPAEELKSNHLEKLVALEHTGTAEAAAQEWCCRCWRAEKGCQGGQRGGRQDTLGQGGANLKPGGKLHLQVHRNEEHPCVLHPVCSLLSRLGL